MDEENEIKDLIKSKKKSKLMDKILESNKVEIIIKRIQDLSDSIKKLIVEKLNLDDEEKEGRLFVILFAIIVFTMISIITLVLLTPLVGIHLIFLFIRYSIFLLYKIIKNKRFEIRKYLHHKFPTSNIFKEKEEFETNYNFTNIIFKEVEEIIQKMDMLNLSVEEKGSISIRLKQIILLVEKEDGNMKHELHNLKVKQEIITVLSNIEYMLEEYQRKEQDEFYITKNNLLTTLDKAIEESNKVLRKV